MLFNSLTFIVFFALVLALHNAPLGWTTKKTNLLVASYLFYAAWNPPFVILVWLSTVIDWHVARRMFVEQRAGRRKMLLAVSVIVNLGILGYFKYGGFLLENFIALAATVGIDYQAPDWSIVLPVGISFYTFQTMAYSLDVYLRRAEPAKSFLDFALFVTFFPQLVAGPIVRPTHLIPQFAAPRVATRQQLYWGLGLITIGLFQKIVVADGLLAQSADKVFSAGETLHPLDAWLGTLAFSGQIFSDFAGYSTTAIGVALALGFGLPDNFCYPYASIGFSDFWRRWHISLSSWLRDYLYIPIGGNRKGNIRTYANLMTTMLLGGLWHGASWTFVVWGGLHGLYLSLHKLMMERDWPRWPSLLAGLVTFHAVTLSWIFFRSPDFARAWDYFTGILRWQPATEALSPVDWTSPRLLVLLSSVMLIDVLQRRSGRHAVFLYWPWWLRGGSYAMLALITLTLGGFGGQVPFIYFQF